MFKKFLLSAFVFWVLGFVLTSVVKADLIGWWRFEEGSGTTAFDSSDYGNDGTLNGDPQWVDGYFGGGLELSSDYVEINGIADDLTENNFAVSAWIKTTMSGDGNVIGANDSGSSHQFIWGVSTSGTHLVEASSTIHAYPPVINDGVWHFIAYVRDGTTAYVYTDGELVGTETPDGDPAGAMTRWSIGMEWDSSPSDFFNGTVDDVHFFNNPLSAEEIQSVMIGEGYPLASHPNPADGSYINDTWVSMSWKPGDFAVSHDVYFSDNLDDVSNGAADAFRGNQTAISFLAGFPGYPYPDGLVPGTTYYWRIDEVNDADPNSPWQGEVWSFAVPPTTAYSPNPADGAESVGPDNVTLSWTAGYGAKLHTVYVGTDFDTVNNASGGAPLGVKTYNPGPLEAEKVYYWRVDEFDAITWHKGDIWSFTTPGAVGNPRPAYDTTDVQMNAILSWTPANSAASHQLYFGTDKDTVRNADTGAPEYKDSKTLGAESYDPGLLDSGTTYYWRVDEVDGQGKTLKGPLWIFTTGSFLSIDDFEGYTDDDTAGKAIWQTWIDGFGVADNGAQVGYLLPPYAEQTMVHGGSQSMPLMYVNETGVTNSEAAMTLTTTKDWTVAGVAELSLWFRGSSSNASEPLYVAVSNSAGAPAVVAHDDADAAASRKWTQWQIPLQALADQGISLTNVNKVAIGLGSKGNPAAAGGSGTIYIDDIRLNQP